MSYEIALDIPTEMSKQSIVPFKGIDLCCTSEKEVPALEAFKDALLEALKGRKEDATSDDPLYVPSLLRFRGDVSSWSDDIACNEDALTVMMASHLEDVPLAIQGKCAVIMLTHEAPATRSVTLSYCVGVKDLETADDFYEAAARVLIELEMRNLPWTNVSHFLSTNTTPFKKLVFVNEPGMGASLFSKLMYHLALQEKEEPLNIPTEVEYSNFDKVRESFWKQQDCFFVVIVQRQSDFKKLAERYTIPVQSDSVNILVVYRELVPPLTKEEYFIHIPRCPSIYTLYVSFMTQLINRIGTRAELPLDVKRSLFL
jgi:hypothetical protein